MAIIFVSNSGFTLSFVSLCGLRPPLGGLVSREFVLTEEGASAGAVVVSCEIVFISGSIKVYY
jgi:hypothetical protein